MIYGYVRVSTAEQATGDSLDTQTSQLKGYAMMRGWDEPMTFIESGVSGSVPFAERPSGLRLMEALVPGDSIVVAKLDRMFRNAADALVTLEAMKERGVSLHMIDLGGDVTGNGIGKLVFTILAAVAESERDRIRERIRDVKRHARQAGKHTGGARPFGYDVVDGALISNEKERQAISYMVELRKAGKSFRCIQTNLVVVFGVDLPRTSIKRIIERTWGVAA